MLGLERNVVLIQRRAQRGREAEFCEGAPRSRWAMQRATSQLENAPVSRDLMIPSAFRSSPESSSRDFSFIQSSTPGVPGRPIPISEALRDAACTSCAVTVLGESRIISSRGVALGAYGGGGARLEKFNELGLRALAGGRGRRGVDDELVASIGTERPRESD